MAESHQEIWKVCGGFLVHHSCRAFLFRGSHVLGGLRCRRRCCRNRLFSLTELLLRLLEGSIRKPRPTSLTVGNIGLSFLGDPAKWWWSFWFLFKNHENGVPSEKGNFHVGISGIPMRESHPYDHVIFLGIPLLPKVAQRTYLPQPCEPLPICSRCRPKTLEFGK